MEDNTVSHSTTRPVPIYPSRSSSGLSTSPAGLDDTTSVGQADSVFDSYYNAFERTSSTFSRSPTTSFSGSFHNRPPFPRERRHERLSRASLDLNTLSPISTGLSSPVSPPFMAPMSRNVSINGRQQDEVYYDWSTTEDGDAMNNRFGATDHSLMNDQRVSSIFSIGQIPYVPLDSSSLDPELVSYGSLDHRHLTPIDHLRSSAPMLVEHPPSRQASPLPKQTAPEAELSQLMAPCRRLRGNSEPSKPPKHLATRMDRTPSINSSCSSEVDIKREDESNEDDDLTGQGRYQGETKPIPIPRARGKRGRPLTTQEKGHAKHVRVNGTVCIRCKLNRQKVRIIISIKPYPA
jgi:hypothetical protein